MARPLGYYNVIIGGGNTREKPAADEHTPVKAETPCGLKVDVGQENSCSCNICKTARENADDSTTTPIISTHWGGIGNNGLGSTI